MPTLDDLRSAAIVSGVPDAVDLVPYFDISEFGNGPVKKTTVSELVVSAAEADPEGIRVAIGVEDGDGNFPINGFVLADHTNSILAEGVYAEDSLGRLRRHDGGTTGGVLVFPPQYVGMSVVDFSGLGGAGIGTVVVLEELQALFSGIPLEGDKIRIYGSTNIQLDPNDLPNVTPAYWGIGFGQNDVEGWFYDFWDLSNEAGADVYQDSRVWTLEFTYLSAAWVVSQPACFTIQQTTLPAGGAAEMATGELTTVLGLTPPPGSLDGGVFTVPLSLILVDSGTPFTSGTARVSWRLNIEVVRA